MTIVAGVDFGTASVRVAIVDDARGRLGAGVASYPVLRDRADPDRATQRHADHLAGLEQAFAAALADAGVDGRHVAALAVATTGSTVVPLDEKLQPLDDYYLWSDHRARAEAQEITAGARAAELPALAYCGGAYSPEWGFAKVLHWLRHNPRKRDRMATAAEHCDVIAATLCGIDEAEAMPRSACAMGHKWMWHAALGGLPPDDFLASVDPLLSGLRGKLGGNYATSRAIAGTLSGEWAGRLGLNAGIPVPVGALDAHWDAVGAGCRLGDVVNVVGTSTCIMAVSDACKPIPGVAGVVQGSVDPDRAGIEAGLAAVGDLFDAIARRAGTNVADLFGKVARHRAGQTGLLRLAWDNGDRTVLADPGQRGVTLGWRLHHEPADELFAAIEGTGFHTRIILERMAAHGVPVRRVINAGGIPARSPVLNQAYASILGKPVLVPRGDGAGLGSAIFAFLATGAFATLGAAQDALCAGHDLVEPDREACDVYADLFEEFSALYFSPAFPRLFARLERAAGLAMADEQHAPLQPPSYAHKSFTELASESHLSHKS